MKRILIITLLLTTASVCLQSVVAKTIQDKNPPRNFVDRTAPPVSPAAAKEMQASLDQARARYEAEPNNPDALIWFGRRLAYPGRFREAIEVYTKGIEKFPLDARLYRHRGHRYITLRRFDLAIADLRKAAKLVRGKADEIEPDGQPNARNIPTGTLQFNIWYHLGLAYYLTGKNKQALASYQECLKVSGNPDALVATSHWLYMTLRRMNRTSEAVQVLAPIREGMDIIENDGYYRLLLMYKNLISAETLLSEATKQEGSPGSYSILYGIGNWYLYNGRRVEAVQVFRGMVEGSQWTSFGYIAAEADLSRLGGGLKS